MTTTVHETELERLRELLQQAPGAMAIFRGQRYVVEMANRAYLELVGARDVVGRAAVDSLPELAEQGFISLLDRAFAEGQDLDEPIAVELRRRARGDREERVLGFVFKPLRDSGGYVSGMFVQATDITERTRTERALRDSEERYRAFVANSSEAIWCYELEEPLDVDLPLEAQLDHVYRYARLADLNDAMARMYGLERAEQLIGARLEDTLPRDAPASLAFMRRVVEAKFSVRDAESAERDAAGDERYFANTMVPVFEHGKLTRVWGVQRDITERRRTEEALRASEERLRSVFAQTLGGIAETDLTGRFVRVNRRYCEIVGRTELELLSLRMQDITHPHDLPHNLEQFGALLRGESAGFEIEKRYLRPDGAPVWVHNGVALVCDAAGRPRSVVATTIDISERRRAEAALRSTELRLSRIFETNLLGVLYFNVAGGVPVRDANDEFLKIVGYDRADLAAGRIDWSRMTPPELRAEDERAIEKLRRAGVHGPREKQFLRKDGSRVPVLVGSALIDADNGVGFVLDLTASKRAELAVRESEARLRSVIDNMTGLVGMLDREGTLLEVGEPALRVGGLRREDVIGRKFWECGWWLHDPGQQRRIEEWIGAAAKGATIREDVTVRVAGGATLAFDFMLAPVFASDGTVTHVIPSGIDISQRKRMEMALREAAFALRDADRRKDEFLATLAHELRNPLAPIRNAVQLLKLAPQSEAQARTARDIIERQVQHMVRLVDDLLDVSRITLGQVNLKREELTLGAILSEALEAARPAIEAAGHSLHVDLPGEPLVLEGDATRLSQVFQNLLDNAAKYTPRGGRISVAVERRGSEAVVSVSDTGRGIPEEMQERIFELFTRSHSGGDVKITGLGVGLALSRQLVALHNGRMSVESEGTGRGATFRVHLPLFEARTAAARVEREPRPLADGAGRRILVVDDNRDAASSLAMLLEFSGWTVAVAFSGAQALEMIGDFRPDIVLLDIGMPQMDGYEVARRLRADRQTRDVLLVALTGWGQEEDKRRARAAGFDEHLTKPVDQERLNALFRSRLSARSSTS